jgi:hypothetical protein
MHAQLAREMCHPTADKYTKYAYLARSAKVEYRWLGEAWERQEPTNVREAYESETLFPPCGDHAFQNDQRLVEWNPVARPDGESGLFVPVCTTEDDLRPWARPIGRDPETVTFEYHEVTHILGCAKEEAIDVEIEGESSGTSEERASKRVTEDLKMGDEEFQIRVAAEGRPVFDSTRRVVKLALFGKDEIPTGVESLQQYGGVHVAQAEFFFDGRDSEEDYTEEDWMWVMAWNARITRFRPEGEGFEGLLEACNTAIGDNRCSPMLELIEEYPAMVTH